MTLPERLFSFIDHIKFIFRYFLTMFPKFNSCIHVNDLEPRQFGTKTVRHPLKKTVQHQDISAPLKKSVKSAPYFLSNINWVKIGKQELGTPFSKLLDPRLMQQWFWGYFHKNKLRLTLIVSYIELFIFILICLCASSEWYSNNRNYEESRVNRAGSKILLANPKKQNRQKPFVCNFSL